LGWLLTANAFGQNQFINCPKTWQEPANRSNRSRQETKPTKYDKMQVAKLDRETQKHQNYKYFAFLRHCAKSTENPKSKKQNCKYIDNFADFDFPLMRVNLFIYFFVPYPQYLHCANFMFILLIAAK